MDPFEEFEFKPLTDGLGFHKKKTSPAALPTMQESKREGLTDLIKDQGLELIEETPIDPLRSPLPRKARQNNSVPPQIPTEKSNDGSSAVDEILKTLQKNRRFELENEKAKVMAVPTKETFKVSYWSLSAALLDGMLVTAASLLCMIILLVVTKADLVGNFIRPDADGMIYGATGAIFAMVAFVYLVVNRIFVGCTPGEWAFDQRVGLPEELNTLTYSSRVLVRTLVTMVTGFVILPLASWILQKDIAGQISGALLYKK